MKNDCGKLGRCLIEMRWEWRVGGMKHWGKVFKEIFKDICFVCHVKWLHSLSYKKTWKHQVFWLFFFWDDVCVFLKCFIINDWLLVEKAVSCRWHHGTGKSTHSSYKFLNTNVTMTYKKILGPRLIIDTPFRFDSLPTSAFSPVVCSCPWDIRSFRR